MICKLKYEGCSFRVSYKDHQRRMRFWPPISGQIRKSAALRKYDNHRIFPRRVGRLFGNDQNYQGSGRIEAFYQTLFRQKVSWSGKVIVVMCKGEPFFSCFSVNNCQLANLKAQFLKWSWVVHIVKILS